MPVSSCPRAAASQHARLLQFADPASLHRLYSRHLGARGRTLAIGGDSTTMYLATAIAGLSASYKDTPLWRLKKQVLRKPLPWLVASRENSWDALIKYPEPHVFNWTRWGLAAGTQPDVFLLHAGIWCLHMHPWWTWREEWRLPSSQRLLLDDGCCGRARYRARLELAIGAARRQAPHALIVVKTTNALCEEMWLNSRKKAAMAMGRATSLAMAYDARHIGGAGGGGRATRLDAATFESQARDAQTRIGIKFDDYYGFLYRRSGAELQRQIVYDVAAAYSGVQVLDAFDVTSRLGCTFSSDGVHYVQRVRSIIGLDLLDIILHGLFNESLQANAESAAR